MAENPHLEKNEKLSSGNHDYKLVNIMGENYGCIS